MMAVAAITGLAGWRRQALLLVALAACVLCALCPLTGCASAEPAHRSAAAARRTVTLDHGAPVRGDSGRRELALVFTGGEYGEGTVSILDTLRRRGVRASFFVTGDYLASRRNRLLVRRMVAEGHHVGPHSDTHPLYCAWEDRAQTLVTEEFFRADLERNMADLRRLGALAGPGPIYFIPPYEWYNDDQVCWARAMGVVLFNFTPGSGSNRDWIPEGDPRFASSDEILRGILDYEGREPHGLNGFLLLLHLGSQREDKTHLKLPVLVDELTRRGYGFVRVDELLAAVP
jgi:endoglucanase